MHLPFEQTKLSEALLQRISVYRPWIDALILDTSTPQAIGGTGLAFDWQQIEGVLSLTQSLALPLYIAGGITAENLGHLPHLRDLGGVDIASGAEGNYLDKDNARIAQIVKKVKEINREKGELLYG